MSKPYKSLDCPICLALIDIPRMFDTVTCKWCATTLSHNHECDVYMGTDEDGWEEFDCQDWLEVEEGNEAG